MGDLVLDLGRVLRRGMDEHVAILERQCEGDLAFEVEMLLPADLHPAFDDVRGFRQRPGGIASGPDAGPGFEAAVGGQRLIDGQEGGQLLDVELRLLHRLAGGEMAFGGKEEHLLADVMHRAGGKQRLVLGRGGAVGHVVEIFGRPDADDTGRVADRGKVERADAAMRDGRQAEGKMQGAGGRRDVIDIARDAGDMQRPGIVREGFAHAHARTSSGLRSRMRGVWPDSSSA